MVKFNKLKRVVSALLSVALLICAVPADAAISFNGGGGNTYPGSGTGPANWGWSPGSISNRFGYRISVHYAPQKSDGAGNYLTDDNGEPIYDWSQEIQVGHTIDIRQNPMIYTKENKIIKPAQWGLWSAWEYNGFGGAFGSVFKSVFKDDGYNYYYYGFNNDDRYERNTNNVAYMCAIFNTDTVRNSDIVPNEAKANEIVSNIADKLNAALETTNNKEAVQNTIEQLNRSISKYNYYGMNLPLVNNTAEKGSSASVEDLKDYLAHPIVLELLSDAMDGNFTAEDFYFGSWNGSRTGYGDKDLTDKRTFPKGLYKMVIENMTVTGVNGPLTAYTVQDAIAINKIKGYTIWSQLGAASYATGMINTLHLNGGDKVLTFKGTGGWYMGKLLESEPLKEVNANNYGSAGDYYPIDQFIGNYSGLMVLDSSSINSYIDDGDFMIVNELAVSMFEDTEDTAGLMQVNANVKTFLNIFDNDELFFDTLRKSIGAIFDESADIDFLEKAAYSKEAQYIHVMMNNLKDRGDVGLQKEFVKDIILYDTYSDAKKESTWKRWTDVVNSMDMGMYQAYVVHKGGNELITVPWGNTSPRSIFHWGGIRTYLKKAYMNTVSTTYNNVLDQMGVMFNDVADDRDTINDIVNKVDNKEALFNDGSSDKKQNLMYVAQMGRWATMFDKMFNSKENKGLIQLKPMNIWYNDKTIDNGVIKKWAMASHMMNVNRIESAWRYPQNSSVYKRLTDDYILGKNKDYGTLDYDNMVAELQRDAGVAEVPVSITVDRRMKDSGVLMSDTNNGTAKLVATESPSAVTAVYDPSNKEDLVKVISSLAVLNGEMSGIQWENTDEWDRYKYNGVVNFNNLLIDNFCNLEFGIIEKNKENGKTTVLGKENSASAVATRYDSTNIIDSYNAGSQYLYYNGKTYKIKALARVPYDARTGEQLYSLDTFYDKLADEVEDLTSADLDKNMEYDSGEIVISSGSQRVENAAVYPSDYELENSSTIGVGVIVEEVEAPKYVVVYVDNYGSHIDTTIDKLPSGTTEKQVEDIPGYDITAGFVSSDEPVDGLDNKTTWDEIARDCPPYDNQWLKGPGTITVEPGIEQVIYILAKAKRTTSSTVTGGFTLGQQSISKRFDTSGVIKPNLRTWGNTEFTNHKKWKKGTKRRRGHWSYCVINSLSKDTYNIIYNEYPEDNGSIWAKNYSVDVSNNSTGAKKLKSSGITNDNVNPTMKFVLWRGFDKPVAANYANTGYNDEVWSAYGIGSGNKYVNSGTTSSYTKNFNVKFDLNGSTDKDVTFGCSFGRSHSATVGADVKSLQTSLGVNIFEGWKGAQSASSGGSTSSSINGVGMTSVSSNQVAQSKIKFYPYVNMKYQDLAGNTKDLNVLSKYESVISPVSTVEIGYKVGSNDSIGMSTDMWSTHKRALNAHGKNSTLPGGATYRLVNNAAGAPVVGLKTYSWYVPTDAVNAVYEGSYGNTQADAEQRHDATVNELKSAINATGIRQRMQVNGGSTIDLNKGGSAGWLNNLPFMDDAKYWFNGATPRAEVNGVNTGREYYRISSDTNGKVYLVHGSSTDYTFDKSQDVNYILGQLNAEWRDVENKTNLVSAYLKSIIRNEGNDTDYVSDGRWYNEAFPGLCVCVSTTTISVKLSSDVEGRPNVVNMRYIAGNSAQPSKADIYKTYNKTWFSADGTNLSVHYGGTGVGPGGISLNLRTKDWFIPNATVYDND